VNTVSCVRPSVLARGQSHESGPGTSLRGRRDRDHPDFLSPILNLHFPLPIRTNAGDPSLSALFRFRVSSSVETSLRRLRILPTDPIIANLRSVSTRIVRLPCYNPLPERNFPNPPELAAIVKTLQLALFHLLILPHSLRIRQFARFAPLSETGSLSWSFSQVARTTRCQPSIAKRLLLVVASPLLRAAISSFSGCRDKIAIRGVVVLSMGSDPATISSLGKKLKMFNSAAAVCGSPRQ